MPVRIQRKRTKGWKMPPNTVCVSRPSKWGNPWTVTDAEDAGYSGEGLRAWCVDLFREWITFDRSSLTRMLNGSEGDKRAARLVESLPELRGKNLACWCPLDQPCHADVLLELANKPGDTQ